jgi:hypothetical protein
MQKGPIRKRESKKQVVAKTCNMKIQQGGVCFITLVVVVAPGIEGCVDLELSSVISSPSSPSFYNSLVVVDATDAAGSVILLTIISFMQNIQPQENDGGMNIRLHRGF